MINNRLPSKSYSEIYVAEPRYNDLQYDNIPGLMMGVSLTEHKIFLVITIKSTSLNHRKHKYSQNIV